MNIIPIVSSTEKVTYYLHYPIHSVLLTCYNRFSTTDVRFDGNSYNIDHRILFAKTLSEVSRYEH